MTICKECYYHKIIISNDCIKDVKVKNNIWYHNYCTLKEIPKWTNPVSGELEHRYDQKYEYCRDINKDGNCKHFQEFHIN